MSVQTEEIPRTFGIVGKSGVVVPVRRARGLRLPVLPSGPLLAQIGGAVASGVGLYLAAGIAVTLIAAGIASAVLGALREAGKV